MRGYYYTIYIMKIPDDVVYKIMSMSKPLIIGVSGFGGAGKSTFAESLGKELSVQVVGVDHFMKDHTVNDYSLWETMDYGRLKEEVIVSFLNRKENIQYGIFDWHTNKIRGTERIDSAEILIIEGVGLFRPEINEHLGYKIWIDCDLGTSLMRGKLRDKKARGDKEDGDWDARWDGIWKRNDIEYYDTYKPREVADVVVDNCEE